MDPKCPQSPHISIPRIPEYNEVRGTLWTILCMNNLRHTEECPVLLVNVMVQLEHESFSSGVSLVLLLSDTMMDTADYRL